MTLILASTSPRRADLLRQIGVHFVQRAVEIDESPLDGETAAEAAMRLARAKAETALQHAHGDVCVIAADTLVGLDGQILGKPRDEMDFMRTMRLLSGRQHEVCTAVALAQRHAVRAFLCISHVSFRPLTDAEMRAYWQSGEPQDKAGGYAIQGRAAAFITRIEGSYSAIMGLPLFETAELLREAGIALWSAAA